MRKILYLAVLVVLIVSCRQSGQEESKSQSLSDADTELANIIGEVTSYWDKFDFADTTWLVRPRHELEQVFAQWVDGALIVYYEGGLALSDIPVRRAMACDAMLVRFMEMGERCFRDPNSPWRCEELYIPMLKAALASGVDDVHKSKYKAHLETAMMNRKGTIATDFAYVTAGGEPGRLHDVLTDYTLLYFFNPGCHDCERVSGIISTSPKINTLIVQGRLTVLALYPDEDMTAWNEHQGENDESWITARYAAASERDKYDLPAIPNLYLLDRDKRVLLKDAMVEEVIGYLSM